MSRHAALCPRSPAHSAAPPITPSSPSRDHHNEAPSRPTVPAASTASSLSPRSQRGTSAAGQSSTPLTPLSDVSFPPQAPSHQHSHLQPSAPTTQRPLQATAIPQSRFLGVSVTLTASISYLLLAPKPTLSLQLL